MRENARVSPDTRSWPAALALPPSPLLSPSRAPGTIVEIGSGPCRTARLAPRSSSRCSSSRSAAFRPFARPRRSRPQPRARAFSPRETRPAPRTARSPRAATTLPRLPLLEAAPFAVVFAGPHGETADPSEVTVVLQPPDAAASAGRRREGLACLDRHHARQRESLQRSERDVALDRYERPRLPAQRPTAERQRLRRHGPRRNARPGRLGALRPLHLRVLDAGAGAREDRPARGERPPPPRDELRSQVQPGHRPCRGGARRDAHCGGRRRVQVSPLSRVTPQEGRPRPRAPDPFVAPPAREQDPDHRRGVAARRRRPHPRRARFLRLVHDVRPPRSLLGRMLDVHAGPEMQRARLRRRPPLEPRPLRELEGAPAARGGQGGARSGASLGIGERSPDRARRRRRGAQPGARLRRRRHRRPPRRVRPDARRRRATRPRDRRRVAHHRARTARLGVRGPGARLERA